MDYKSKIKTTKNMEGFYKLGIFHKRGGKIKKVNKN